MRPSDIWRLEKTQQEVKIINKEIESAIKDFFEDQKAPIIFGINLFTDNGDEGPVLRFEVKSEKDVLEIFKCIEEKGYIIEEGVWDKSTPFMKPTFNHEHGKWTSWKTVRERERERGEKERKWIALFVAQNKTATSEKMMPSW